jgi:hypothetical protein
VADFLSDKDAIQICGILLFETCLIILFYFIIRDNKGIEPRTLCMLGKLSTTVP